MRARVSSMPSQPRRSTMPPIAAKHAADQSFRAPRRGRPRAALALEDPAAGDPQLGVRVELGQDLLEVVGTQFNVAVELAHVGEVGDVADSGEPAVERPRLDTAATRI